MGGEVVTIWDIHCHPQAPRIQGRTLMEKVETLIRVADRMGIERLGLFLRPGKEAKEIQDVLVRYRNKVFGFLWMTLWNDTIESHIDALNRWIRDGPMVGMKMAGGDGVCRLAVYDAVFRAPENSKPAFTSIPGSRWAAIQSFREVETYLMNLSPRTWRHWPTATRKSHSSAVT